MANKKPLCVDLDGTLVLTDTMFESFFALLKKEPLTAIKVWWWLRRGKTAAKHGVASRIELAASDLPYNKELLTWLAKEKASGRRLCLVTGSNEAYAKVVADHLGIFDETFGSSTTHNLSGADKARFLVNRFGKHGFSYAGNSLADLPVWEQAGEIIVVNATPTVKQRASRVGKISRQFGEQRLRAAIVLRAMRWHQWVKNLLIFIPLLTAHQLTDQPTLVAALLAFIAFCAIASAIYLMNDLVDLGADRLNEYKKHRPLAAGTMPILTALQLGLALGFISIAISLFLPPLFFLVIALYVVSNITYSLFLKRVVIADVLLIASLYVLRIFAGSAATAIPTSPWLFAFAAFVFLSLALVKRTSEIANLQQKNRIHAVGRGYTAHHYQLLKANGIGSSVVSIVVLAFYVQSPTVQSLYDQPFLLWLLIPLFAIWLSRVWRITLAGNMHEDPTAFAAKDPVSYVTAVIAVLIVFLAT